MGPSTPERVTLAFAAVTTDLSKQGTTLAPIGRGGDFRLSDTALHGDPSGRDRGSGLETLFRSAQGILRALAVALGAERRG
jgi:hypothetical protein